MSETQGLDKHESRQSLTLNEDENGRLAHLTWSHDILCIQKMSLVKIKG